MSELPEPQPVHVIHHRIFTGWCAQCQQWHEASVDLQEDVVGQGRIGVRVTSLIATLRTVMRLPVRQIRALLLLLSRCEISSGEAGTPSQCWQCSQERSGPADEAGWREDGEHGST